MNTQGMKNLMTHIITQAYQDLYGRPTRQAALRFFLSADCKSYCAALGYSPEKIRGIACGRV